MRKHIQIFVLFSIISLNNYSYAQTFEKITLSLPGFQDSRYATVPYNAGAGAVQCGDYNSDGKMDIVIQGTGTTPTNLFKNIGDFSFENANLPWFSTNNGILGNSYNAAKFADFDNDGLIDIVCNGTGYVGTGTLLFLFNNGDGTFTNVPLSGAGRSYGITEISDFNNDGFLDIYTNGGERANSVGDDGGAELIKNLGSRSFQVIGLSQIPNGTYRTARCVDINKDGFVDILQSSNTGLKTFINKGGFIFTEENLQGVTSSFSDSKPLLIEDFNNDGILDIVTYDSNLGDAIYFKQSDGSYQAQRFFPAEITESAKFMVAGDLNNDGNLDICAHIAFKLYVFYNNGSGSFTTYEIIDSNINLASFWFNYSIALADFDNDGDLDIIASNRHTDNSGSRIEETDIFKNNTSVINNPPYWNAKLNVSVYNNDISFNWIPTSDDHTPKKGFKYNLFIGKWDDVTNSVSQIISPSNVTPHFNGIPSSPSLIAYPEMATIDTFAVRRLDKGKYVAVVIQIDQSYKVGKYGAEIFEVTSNLCSAPIPTISDVTLTGGGTTVLTPSGGTSYVWYNAAYGGTSISTGTSFTTPYLESTTSYYVANNDGNCESQRVKVTVTVNPIPLSFSSQPIEVLSTIGSNIQFTATVNKPSVLYQWQSNPCNVGWQNVTDNSIYSGATTSALSIKGIQLSNHLQPFRVVVTKGAETNTSDIALLKIIDTCFISVTDTLIIKSTLVTSTPPNNTNIIKIFPNPTKDHITINFGNYIAMNGYSIKISNSLGQSIFTTSINQQTEYIDLSTWSGNGLYFVHIIDNLGKTIEIRKIILK